MRFLIAGLLVLTPGFAATADKATLALVEYFLKTPTSQADPKLVDRFLAVKADDLPPKLRRKVDAKQVEIRVLIRLHDTKKMGVLIQPAEACGPKDFIKPLEIAPFFSLPTFETVTEDELKYVRDKTQCTEIDLGCRFSMLIFFKEKKPRIVRFAAADPIMDIVAEARGRGGGTKFFGAGFSCMH